MILEQDGVVARQRLEDGHVRCREFETDGADGGRSFEMGAQHAAAEAEFGRSLPRLEAELRVGGVPDLDVIETSIRERALGLGAKTYGSAGGARRRRSASALPELRPADGVSRASDFAARLEQFGCRNALFKAEELVVLSDGAPWIRTVCEEILAGPDMTFILDLFHALEKAADAVQDLTADEGERTAGMDWIRERLNAGQVAQVTAALEPHRHQSEAVAAFIRYCGTNADQMRCDLYRVRGLPVGSGVVESACKHIVGNRFKKAGCRWSKAGANVLLAIRCCLENMRWPDFLEWRACRAAAA